MSGGTTQQQTPLATPRPFYTYLDNGLYFYEASNGQVEYGRIDANKLYQPITTFKPKTLYPGWTHVINIGGLFYLFFYEASTSLAEVGGLDAVGNYYPIKNYPAGTFSSAGWTHIVSSAGYLFCYDASPGPTGGRAEVGGFDQYQGNYLLGKYFPPQSFYVGWTHILLMQGINLLFYEASTGRVEMGQLGPDKYQPIHSFPPGSPGSFYKGWTHIVNVYGGDYDSFTPETLLFYEASTGRVEMGRLDANSNYQPIHSFPPGSPGSFYKGWTHIVNDYGILFFYEASTGRAEIGHLDANSYYEPFHSFDPGTFHTGWTHIIPYPVSV